MQENFGINTYPYFFEYVYGGETGRTEHALNLRLGCLELKAKEIFALGAAPQDRTTLMYLFKARYWVYSF